jgi:ABC-type amino acid transport substrate-binding protein
MYIWFRKAAMACLLLLGFGVALPTTGNTADQVDTIQSIKDSGVLRVGMAESLPMQFKDPATGGWQGYNADMAQDLAKILGVKLEIEDATWATLIPGLLANKYDVVMCDMWATPQRAITVVFTDPYNVYGWSVMVRQGTPYKTWEDLNKPGIIISVLAGTADEQTARRYFPNATVKPLVSENVNAPRLEVANDRADAVVTDLLNIKAFIAANPQAGVRILQEERVLSPTGLAYAIRPGDYHFLNFLNTWIRSDVDSGRAQELRTKWIKDFKWPGQKS